MNFHFVHVESEVMNGEKLNNEPSSMSKVYWRIVFTYIAWNYLYVFFVSTDEVNNASKEDEKPIGKSKKPQIMPEIMKEHINIVFIGHVGMLTLVKKVVQLWMDEK